MKKPRFEEAIAELREETQLLAQYAFGVAGLPGCPDCDGFGVWSECGRAQLFRNPPPLYCIALLLFWTIVTAPPPGL